PIRLPRKKFGREDARDLFLAQQLLLAQQLRNRRPALRRLLRDLGRARVADQRIERRRQGWRADVVRLTARAIGVDAANAFLDEYRQVVFQDLDRERDLERHQRHHDVQLE